MNVEILMVQSCKSHEYRRPPMSPKCYFSNIALQGRTIYLYESCRLLIMKDYVIFIYLANFMNTLWNFLKLFISHHF